MAPTARRQNFNPVVNVPFRHIMPILIAVALLSLAAWSAPAALAQRAPALAVAEFDIPLLSTPDGNGEVITELPAGYEMELTGDASGPYVEVAAAGTTGWVEVATIHAGQVTTGVTNAVTNVTDAPNDDGRLLTVVPAGETVILTGAMVDDYLAGAYQGTGGWMPSANVDR